MLGNSDLTKSEIEHKSEVKKGKQRLETHCNRIFKIIEEDAKEEVSQSYISDKKSQEDKSEVYKLESSKLLLEEDTKTEIISPEKNEKIGKIIDVIHINMNSTTKLPELSEKDSEDTKNYEKSQSFVIKSQNLNNENAKALSPQSRESDLDEKMEEYFKNNANMYDF